MDGTIRYTFAAEVSPNVPAVCLTLTVSPTLVLFAEATFNEQAHTELGNHHQEEAQIIQNALLDAG